MIEKLFEVKKIIHKLEAFIVIHLRFVSIILPFHDFKIAIQDGWYSFSTHFLSFKNTPKNKNSGT